MDAMDGFIERDEDGAEAYLAEASVGGVTREELIESMEAMLVYSKKAAYQWDDDFHALIYSTVARSGRTFDGICKLLRSGLAVQAAMLSRTLFEDMVVGHWLLFNHADPDWLVERFVRQREAIALHKERIRDETGGAAMGPPLTVADDAKSREQSLIKEFGSEAQRDWWDPGRQGKGVGRPVGIRKLVNLLEDAAAEHKMFHPRIAGGEQPLLRTMERVTYKWLNQCIHHTTVGLPFTLSVKGKAEKSPDPMFIVAWNASWIYAQQIYLAHDAAGLRGRSWEATWWQCMLTFSEYLGRSEWTDRLENELMAMLADADSFGIAARRGARGRLYARWLGLREAASWWWLRLRTLRHRRSE
jgi:hypothetical protein